MVIVVAPLVLALPKACAFSPVLPPRPLRWLPHRRHPSEPTFRQFRPHPNSAPGPVDPFALVPVTRLSATASARYVMTLESCCWSSFVDCFTFCLCLLSHTHLLHLYTTNATTTHSTPRSAPPTRQALTLVGVSLPLVRRLLPALLVQAPLALCRFNPSFAREVLTRTLNASTDRSAMRDALPFLRSIAKSRKETRPLPRHLVQALATFCPTLAAATRQPQVDPRIRLRVAFSQRPRLLDRVPLLPLVALVATRAPALVACLAAQVARARLPRIHLVVVDRLGRFPFLRVRFYSDDSCVDETTALPSALSLGILGREHLQAWCFVHSHTIQNS